MLTRRHIRAKVMQALYAYKNNEVEDLRPLKKFLGRSMTEVYNLFILDLDLLVETREYAKVFMEKSKQKYLATEEEKNPNINFIENKLIQKIEGNGIFQEMLEKRKLNNWRIETHYIQNLWKELLDSEPYKKYTEKEGASFKEDKEFIVEFYKKFVAPNEKIRSYLEDTNLTWVDDFPLVNTAVVKFLRKIKEESNFKMPDLFKNEDDRDFANTLFSRTLTYKADLDNDIEEKSLNWDRERLADIDVILIKMALCEFLYFPTIPVKVTINEYIELAKDYSTPKSNIFINGILDRISKDYQDSGRLNKTGRGLR